MTPSDVREQLYDISCTYARSADRRDVDGFLAIFAEEAQLSVSRTVDGRRAVRTVRGHGELASVLPALARYDRTFHLLGQASYEHDGDRATGEVYCVAHHLTIDGARCDDTVMYIRYTDDYRRDTDGVWRIEHRRVHLEWTETHPADLPGRDEGEHHG